MMGATQIRATARQMVRENKKVLYVATLVNTLILVAFSVVTSLLSWIPGLSVVIPIATLFVTFPLSLGLIHIFNLVYYRRSATTGNMFDFFKSYSVALRALGVVGILMAIVFGVMFVLVIAMGAAMFAALYGDPSGAVMATVGLIMIVVFTPLGVIISSIELVCCYLVMRNHTLPFGQLFSTSMKLGFQSAWRYFCLQFSYIGWYILSVLLVMPLMVIVFMYALGTYVSPLVLVLVLLLTLVVFIFYVALFLGVRITSATTIFYNTVIDRYEQKNPLITNTPYQQETNSDGTLTPPSFTAPPAEGSDNSQPPSESR